MIMPSTAIRFISYDAGSSRLSITFITGRRYIYENVPEGVYQAFLTAPSRGQYFNFEIRDRYDYHEVKRSA
jgi:KTSC domain-containing protein